MPTVAELTERIATVIQDGSLSQDIVPALNRGLRQIAGHRDVRLPGCDASATVKTSTAHPYVALPADYQKHLYWVGSASQEKRIGKLYPSFTTFLRDFPDPALDESGDVRACAIKGKLLYYQGIPTTADTLTLHYYRLPALLAKDDQVPEELPEHLQDPLLVAYACKELFSLIEDDADGKKTQTLFWEAKFARAFEELKEFVEHHGEPDFIPDETESARDLVGYLP